METIAVYAANRGVSYEAVRRQIKRYSEELAGHVLPIGRQLMLDDFATAFLDEHRAPRTTVIEVPPAGSREALEEIRRLQALVIERDAKIMELLETQAAIADQTARLTISAEQLEETAAKLTEAQEIIRQQADEMERQRDAIRAAQDEAGRYKRTFFGLYRRN